MTLSATLLSVFRDVPHSGLNQLQHVIAYSISLFQVFQSFQSVGFQCGIWELLEPLGKLTMNVRNPIFA